MENGSKVKKYISILLILILLITIFAIYATNGSNTSNRSNVETEETIKVDNTNSPNGQKQVTDVPVGEVTIGTQALNQNIIIDQVNLSKAGFIVIFDKLGKVVDQTGLLSAGFKTDLLLKNKISNQGKYSAKIYVDNGDAKFDLTTDSELKNVEFEVK